MIRKKCFLGGLIGKKILHAYKRRLKSFVFMNLDPREKNCEKTEWENFKYMRFLCLDFLQIIYCLKKSFPGKSMPQIFQIRSDIFYMVKKLINCMHGLASQNPAYIFTGAFV